MLDDQESLYSLNVNVIKNNSPVYLKHFKCFWTLLTGLMWVICALEKMCKVYNVTNMLRTFSNFYINCLIIFTWHLHPKGFPLNCKPNQWVLKVMLWWSQHNPQRAEMHFCPRAGHSLCSWLLLGLLPMFIRNRIHWQMPSPTNNVNDVVLRKHRSASLFHVHKTHVDWIG